MLKKFFLSIYLASKRFYLECYFDRVSALAFTTLLAIVPLFAVVFYFISRITLFENIFVLSETYLKKYFLPNASNQIETYFQQFIYQASLLPFISILFLFFTGIMLVNTIVDTINVVWHSRTYKKNIFELLVYWLLIICMPFLLGITIFITTYIFSLIKISNVTTLLIAILPVLINTLLFSTVYKITPHVHVKWRYCFLGGLLAAIVFEGTRLGFGFYVTYFSNYQAVYGAFAIFPVFLMWLYVSWCIFLWGALFTHTISHFKPSS